MDLPIKQEVITNCENDSHETSSNSPNFASINGGVSQSRMGYVKVEPTDYDSDEYSFGDTMAVKVKQENTKGINLNETKSDPPCSSSVDEDAIKSSIVHVKFEPADYGSEDFKTKSEPLLHHELDIKKEEPAFDDDLEMSRNLNERITSVGFEVKAPKHELANEEFKIKLEPPLHHELDIKKEELASDDDWEMPTKLQQTVRSVDFDIKPLKLESSCKDLKIKSEPLLHHEVDIKDEPGSGDLGKMSNKPLKHKSLVKNEAKKRVKAESKAETFKCNICGFKGTSKNQLARHLRTHSGEKPYNCKLCDFRSATNGTLVHHMRTHSGEKPFVCKICGHGCTQKTNLNRHMKKHTGDKPFKCSFCDHRCSRKCHLEEHVRRHQTEFPFQCSLCEYRCYLKHHLQRHIKMHTGREPA